MIEAVKTGACCDTRVMGRRTDRQKVKITKLLSPLIRARTNDNVTDSSPGYKILWKSKNGTA
jgi:hypothetical protein